jgi:hypothetical protein
MKCDNAELLLSRCLERLGLDDVDYILSETRDYDPALMADREPNLREQMRSAIQDRRFCIDLDLLDIERLTAYVIGDRRTDEASLARQLYASMSGVYAIVRYDRGPEEHIPLASIERVSERTDDGCLLRLISGALLELRPMCSSDAWPRVALLIALTSARGLRSDLVASLHSLSAKTPIVFQTTLSYWSTELSRVMVECGELVREIGKAGRFDDRKNS